MATQKIAKGDTSGSLKALQEIVGKLREQAGEGEIDGSLLDQMGAILDVSVTTAPDPHTDMASEAASQASAPVEAPKGTPSMPPAPEMKKETSEAPMEQEQPEKESAPDEPLDEGDEASSIPAPEAASDAYGESSTKVRKQMPITGRPPIKQFTAPNLVFDQTEELRAQLPAFMKALESGSVKRAQEVAGHNQVAFDTLFNMSMHATLSEGGWTTQNMSKLAGIANQDVTTPQGLKKALTASSVPGIYLIKLAKLMLPVYAGLVNRLPAQSPQGMSSNQATWRAQLGFGSIAEASGFRVAEAAIGVVPPTSFLTFNAPFSDIAYNDSVTLKAIAAGRGYSDPLQISVIKTMAALLRLQERVTLGSTYAKIDAPTSVTASGSSTGGTLAAGSYIVGVTALTYEGWLTPSTGGASAVGESTPTYASVVVTSGSTSCINVTWPAVPGAVAYNLYIPTTGGAGSAGAYNKTVTINKATVTAASTSTNTPPGADTSVNAYGQEGLLSWCERSTVYGNAIPDKVTPYDNAGAGLTAGNGGITQFDYLLAQQWSKWHIAPSVMVMSPNMNATLVGKLMSLNNSSLYRIEVSSERGTIAGGAMVTGYVNKFAPFADGTPRYVDVIPHPYMPDGTILFLCETIPYPMGNETRGFVRDVLLPYTYFPLASTTAQYNYSLLTSEVVEAFNPSPQSAIVGVDYAL
jgi:hypothetical protein